MPSKMYLILRSARQGASRRTHSGAAAYFSDTSRVTQKSRFRRGCGWLWGAAMKMAHNADIRTLAGSAHALADCRSMRLFAREIMPVLKTW